MNQKISILWAIIFVSGLVIGHEVVVEVVIASHSYKEYATPQCLGHIHGSQVACYLIKRVLKVLYLLVEWYTTHLRAFVHVVSYMPSKHFVNKIIFKCMEKIETIK